MTDARLLLPAAAAWGGAWLGGTTGSGAAALSLWVPSLVAGAGALLMIAALVSRRSAQATALLVGGCLAAGLLAGWLQSAAIAADSLASWARAHATASIVGVVVGEPRRRESRGPAWATASRTELRVTTSQVTARGGTVDVEVPMLARFPDDVAIPPPGTVLRISGRLGPGSPDSPTAATVTVSSVTLLGPPGPLDGWAHDSRLGLQRALDGTARDAAALVAGLAVGDESLQSRELSDAMRSSGLAHLTAVSGGNVAIIVVTLLGLAVMAGLSLPVRVVVALVGLAMFVVLVGPQPSVLRAAVMGAVVLVGLVVGGRRTGPSVLATAVLGLVLVSPALARSWAFALSAVATGGLVMLAPRIGVALRHSPVIRRLPPILIDAAAVTLAAQVTTLPLLALMGASVGWVAVPANLLAMPAVPVVTVLGLSSAVVSPLLPGPAGALAHGAAWPAGWIAAVAYACVHWPGAGTTWPHGATGVLALAALVVVLVTARRWTLRTFPAGTPPAALGLAAALVATTSALWLVLPPGRRAWPPPDWLVVMCDVAQGDAVLLRSGPEAAVVVDAGPDPALVDSCLADAGVHDVSAVVLTHFHADHVDGLPGVLRGRAVGAALVTPVRDPADRAAAVDRWLADAGLRATPATAGQNVHAGTVTWRVLWPRRIITDGSIPNNASLVLDARVGGRSILLTGDIESEAQSAILPDLARGFDIVKVPHHGSSDQDPRLPGAVGASVALVSVGEGNPYGHPGEDALGAWVAAGAQVARTDLDGAVAVVARGSGVGFVTQGRR